MLLRSLGGSVGSRGPGLLRLGSGSRSGSHGRAGGGGAAGGSLARHDDGCGGGWCKCGVATTEVRLLLFWNAVVENVQKSEKVRL